MKAADVPYCVIGATALAARGLPRMTRDLDLVVRIDNAARSIRALIAAKLRPETPIGTEEDPEPMIVFVDPSTGVEVDLLVAAGDPEATVCEEAPTATLFGVRAPVATLEHLLLMYLYSNQPKHLGDFASIVVSGRADPRRLSGCSRGCIVKCCRRGGSAYGMRSRRRCLLGDHRRGSDDHDPLRCARLSRGRCAAQ
jgi:hypothetical protein